MLEIIRDFSLDFSFDYCLIGLFLSSRLITSYPFYNWQFGVRLLYWKCCCCCSIFINFPFFCVHWMRRRKHFCVYVLPEHYCDVYNLSVSQWRTITEYTAVLHRLALLKWAHLFVSRNRGQFEIVPEGTRSLRVYSTSLSTFVS